MNPNEIGLIGFGEVGSVFSAALARHGARLRAYDSLLEQPSGRRILESRRLVEGIQFASLAEVVASSGYILSMVTTQVAEQVARQCRPYLAEGKVYIDFNSTSPAVKLRIAEIISPSGADFVEGAILGAVGAAGAAVRLLLAGERGAEAAEILEGLGLNAHFYSSQVGQASGFKMLRSVFSKGVEALLLEMMISAWVAGIHQSLWDEVISFMSEHPFDSVAENWIKSHAVAHERRYHEMAQVVETIQDSRVEPIMASATEAFFSRSTDLGFGEVFSERPSTVEEVVAFMAEKLAGGA